MRNPSAINALDGLADQPTANINDSMGVGYGATDNGDGAMEKGNGSTEDGEVAEDDDIGCEDVGGDVADETR